MGVTLDTINYYCYTINSMVSRTIMYHTSAWCPLSVRIFSKWSASQCLTVLSLEQVNR